METLWVDEKSNWDNRAYYQTTFSQRLSWCCTHLYRWKMAEIAGFKSGEGCQDCLTSGWRILTFRGNMVSLVAVDTRTWLLGLVEEAELVWGFILLHAGSPDLINPLPGLVLFCLQHTELVLHFFWFEENDTQMLLTLFSLFPLYLHIK